MAQKTRKTAALFAFLLGGVGVHSFYLGFKTKGIIHVVLYAVGVVLACIPYIGWVTGVPLAIANSVWALIEAIKIVSNKNFVDANGNPLA
jgi:TM2 domain-containing membrane protein YozV